MRRLAAAFGVVLGVIAGTVVVPLPAYASACDGTSSGVTIVVDFGAFGAGVDVRCSPGDPGDGVVALRGAGFGVTGTQRWGDAFVCRIDGLPNATTEACVNTPPANAYWSYWHAPRGGAWTYSSLGARAYNPSPGWVEGWSFGSGVPPGMAPPAAPAEAPPPAPPPPDPVDPPAPQPVNPPAANPPAANPQAPNPPAGEPVPAGTPSGASTSDPAGSPSPERTPPAASGVDTVDRVATSDSGQSTMDSTGTVVGIALVLVLAGVATVVAIRRRRVPP